MKSELFDYLLHRIYNEFTDYKEILFWDLTCLNVFGEVLNGCEIFDVSGLLFFESVASNRVQQVDGSDSPKKERNFYSKENIDLYLNLSFFLQNLLENICNEREALFHFEIEYLIIQLT